MSTDDTPPIESIPDGAVAMLRAMLVGDADGYDRLSAHGEVIERRFAVMLAAAFSESVARRFGRDRLAGDVIHFVAAVRVRNIEDVIDPVAAESLIRLALGEASAIEGLDQMALARTQALLLAEMVSEEQLDEHGLDEFLDNSRARAEAITG